MKEKSVTCWRDGAASLFICLLLISAAGMTNAQTPVRYSVSGIILDAQTNDPLRYVNVFLNNTSLGGVSDEYGRFTIRGIPPGKYELVAAMIGYGREIKEITVTGDSRQQSILFRLKQESVVAPTITVTARRDDSWKKDLQVFEFILLGDDAHAKSCRIENPEVLRFSREEPYFLQAAASEPLKIHNPYLGYDITYFIDEFIAQQDGRLLFTGNIQFTPVKNDDKEAETRVMKNRVMAYYGSVVHFFRSLIRDSLETEGFAAYALTESPMQRGSKVLRQLKADSIVYSPAEHMDVEISLPEWVKVVYSGEGENPYYARELRKQTNIKEDYARQISYLNSMVTPLVCARSGHLLVPQLVIRYGHWAFERLAEMLPMNYHPDYQLLSRPAAIDSLPAALLIRRGLEMAAADSIELGSYYVYTGIDRLEESTWADTLFTQLSDVLADDEKRAFQKSEDRAGKLKRMLERRDPSPATPENEFLWEHWQRRAFALNHYPAATPVGYDERGQVYVKYGAPFTRRTFSSSKMLADSECWIYQKTGREVVIDFENHGDGYRQMKYIWEMTPDGLINPGWGQVKAFINDRALYSYQYRLIQSGPLSAFGEFTSGRGEQEEPLTGEALQILEQEYRMAIRQSWEELPVSLSDLSKTRALLPHSISTARFYRNGQTRLECYLAVPWEAMIALPGSDNRHYAFRRAIALRDTAGTILHSSDDRMILFRDEDPFYRAQVNFLLDTGQYSLAVELQNSTAGLYAEELIPAVTLNRPPEKRFLSDILERPPDRQLFLSDIQLSDSLSAAALDKQSLMEVKGAMYIRPFPFRRIEQGEQVTLYLEVYNTVRSTEGLCRARVTCTVFPVTKRSIIHRLFSRIKPVIREQQDLEEGGEYPGLSFALDTSGLEKGDYRIVVTVFDEISGQRAERECQVTVLGD